MICKRCQRSLKGGEGVKCGICESCFHMSCIKDHHDGGDKGYQWKCSLCQNYIWAHTSDSDISKEKDKEINNLIQAVNAIREKFKLINKIQLPKLNSDLAEIKTVADRIFQQNNDILRKIDVIEHKRKNDKYHNSASRYRRRNISLISTPTIPLEKKEEAPILLNEKNVRYRTRRRSYLFNRIFIILNRKMNRTQSPKR